MKIPLNWLKEFVSNNLSAERTADIFTNLGFLIEKINKDVLDAEINPNRGDCFSIIGLSREFAAAINKNINIPKILISDENLDKPLSVEIKDRDLCKRYSYRIIENVEIKDSPVFIRERLEKSGIRPLANIIDITNYIMLETGQPLHAFDYDTLLVKNMILRKSKDGEIVKTLDGNEHKLDEGVLVIENDNRLIDLAGIMGGELSEISKKTKNIILQSAIFDSKNIRNTSKKLGISTEASMRYERGVDFEGNLYALDKACSMILKYAGGKAGEITDIINEIPKTQEITFSKNQINHLIGQDTSENEIINILKKLEFKVLKDKNKITVLVPSWRKNDVTLWQDLAEEVARFKGYNNIEKSVIPLDLAKKVNLDFSKNQILSDILSDNKFIETLSYSFISEEDVTNLNLSKKNLLNVINPISLEYKYLRPKLLPSVLKQVSKNPWAPEIKMFEIGKIYTKDKESEELIVVSSQNQKIFNTIIEELKNKFQIKNINFKISQVPQNILDIYKIRKQIFVLEIDLKTFFDNVSEISEIYNEHFPKIKFKEFGKFSPTVRDLAFILDQNIASEEILNQIQKFKNVLFVELFDEFVSDKFGKNKKNLGFHVWFSDPKKTISEKESSKLTNDIIKTLKEKFSATLRNF